MSRLMRMLLVAALVAGCGSSGDDDGATADASPTSDGGPTADATPVADGITIGGMTYALTGVVSFLDTNQNAYLLYASTDASGTCPASAPACADVSITWDQAVTQGTVSCSSNAVMTIITQGKSYEGRLGQGSCSFDVAVGAVGAAITLSGMSGTLAVSGNAAETIVVTDGQVSAPRAADH
jgi:hypothetical protein